MLAEAAFQRMSVSAEHHLPVTEVKTKNLPAYLTDMRKQGYTIIGRRDTHQLLKNHSLPSSSHRTNRQLPLSLHLPVSCKVSSCSRHRTRRFACVIASPHGRMCRDPSIRPPPLSQRPRLRLLGPRRVCQATSREEAMKKKNNVNGVKYARLI